MLDGTIVILIINFPVTVEEDSDEDGPEANEAGLRSFVIISSMWISLDDVDDGSNSFRSKWMRPKNP